MKVLYVLVSLQVIAYTLSASVGPSYVLRKNLLEKGYTPSLLVNVGRNMELLGRILQNQRALITVADRERAIGLLYTLSAGHLDEESEEYGPVTLTVLIAAALAGVASGAIGGTVTGAIGDAIRRTVG
uniref:Hypothetical secreted protein 1447 n=1 Tax=Amblyomma variegatum TaxID=34610 RepID=F0J9V9_AMBVA|nr:TPA_inf: hypothetical secreted protein 1447 [Amblyomma variegatum]